MCSTNFFTYTGLMGDARIIITFMARAFSF